MPGAVEELFCYVPLPAATIIPRYAAQAVELTGGVGPVGGSVLASAESANKDSRAFGEPERLT